MSTSLSRRVATILALLAAISPGLAVAQSAEFQINLDPTVPGATRPTVAVDAVGNFVVVWEGWEPFPFNVEVYGKRYDAEANPLGGQFLVNTTPVPPARPAAGVAEDGRFVAAWTFGDAFGQLYDAAGAVVGSEFLVSTAGGGALDPVAVASADDGRFVAVWAGVDDGSSLGVFGQRFDASGAPLGVGFPVNTVTEGRQSEPDVAVGPDGSFVVVWENELPTPDVVGRRYDASGNPVGEEFRVNSLVPGPQYAPAVAISDSGIFVVVWQSDEQDGDAAGIFGRRFDGSGALGGEFPVNNTTEGSQSRPDVAVDAEGAFTVVWDGPGPGFNSGDIFSREYDEEGVPRGGELPVNPTTFGERFASIAMTDSGDAVVVYERIGAGAFGQVIERAPVGLAVSGTCPGTVTVSLVNAPPNSEVAVIAAANGNGFVKSGPLCGGTPLAIGEPFKLPPTWIVVDGEGKGSAEVEVGATQCWIQALALEDCATSNLVRAP